MPNTPADNPTIWEPLSRPHVPVLDEMLGLPQTVLDAGFVRLIDYMGDEAAIVQAARVSYGAGTKKVNEDRGLIRYLMRHQHTTPFEMAEIKIHARMPIFVARQWIRHRTASVNELSGRYSEMPGDFYVPEPEHICEQSETNRQGRGSQLADAHQVAGNMQSCMGFAADWYKAFIDEEGGPGVARETARITLPLATYTEWYWKVDLHNLLHFLRLRLDEHAQYEIRVYAEAIARIVKVWMPNVWEAFEDYQVHAHTFSRQEMDALTKWVSDIKRGVYVGNIDEAPVANDLSKRERAAFLKALGISDA